MTNQEIIYLEKEIEKKEIVLCQTDCEYQRDCNTYGRLCKFESRAECWNWHLWKQMDLENLFKQQEIQIGENALKEHNQIIEDLEGRLIKIGMIIQKNKKYFIPFGEEKGEGEIDIYGINECQLPTG